MRAELPDRIHSMVDMTFGSGFPKSWVIIMGSATALKYGHEFDIVFYLNSEWDWL